MRKNERVRAALAGLPVDRPPISIWKHFPAADRDPVQLAQEHIAFQKQFDLDFIKLTPYDSYPIHDWGGEIRFFETSTEVTVLRRPVVTKHTDWLNIKALDAARGAWGRQGLAVRLAVALAEEDVPVVPTVYSPLTVARKLAGERLAGDLRDHPQLMHRVLEAITETTVSFVKEALHAGAAGVFFATACANQDFLSPEAYEIFGRRYDLQVLAAAQEGWFNTLHIHGRKIFFDEFLDYPVHALNWHDSHEYPPLCRARALTDKCIIGGLDEEGAISYGSPGEVIEEVAYFLSETDLRGVMVGPGCVTAPNPPDNNVATARLVVERYAQKDLWKYLSFDSAAL
ncbi:uroporphyrinogen decarboxylase family protein [Anaeroarcus burkinensis]|uniref:uroporphyrinogen decarboxylase family protein n=1 Tax=Anaeroarcus burkinensis TaxID=82376 RepID=UPI0004150586|nr:uroporphyrinogen decarboxylase family protein [Anaeroarcus burkinensis]